MQVLAPAKINLSLKILGRRNDGFHELDTLIAPISLYDEIRIDKGRPGKRIEFRCDDPSIPQGDDNLAVHAAKAFFDTTKIEPAVSIELKKKIPHGAGLGGGSSDAASVLLALNEMFKTKLSREALAEIAEPLGSDVPFFLFQSAAVCKGHGEIVMPVKLQRQILWRRGPKLSSTRSSGPATARRSESNSRATAPGPAAGVFHRPSFWFDFRDAGAALHLHDLIAQKSCALEFEVRRSFLHFF